MKQREKRLLRIALIIFIGYVLPFKVYPIALNFYQDQMQTFEDLHREIDRSQRLFEKTQYWREQHAATVQERDQVFTSLLGYNEENLTQELIGGRIQGLLKKLARNSNIVFKSHNLPEYQRTGDWLLITQTMQFEASSKTLIDFLKALQNAKEKLIVTNLSIRSTRNKLVGTIKISAFSLLPLTEIEE